MQLFAGKIVWTCDPSIESGYDTGLREPRQVKLRHDCRGVWYGHSFNHETGEIDTDTNATVYARDNNCFETEKEANLHYESYLKGEIAGLQAELEDFRKRKLYQR